MNVLLDSHVFIWQDTDAARITPKVMSIMTDPANRVLFSVASIWEIAVKIQIGKLRLTNTLEIVLAQQQAKNKFAIISITTEHALRVGQLPSIHKDPFDRMLVAQALVENATILTDDKLVRQYPVSTDW